MSKNKTLSEQAYSNLKMMIMNKQFSPGEKLTEELIAKNLGVSRTTVKKAFTTLVRDGVLEDRPRQGVFIRSYSKDEILEIYDLREVTEGLCARYAAINISKKMILELEEIYKRMQIALEEEQIDNYVQCDMEFHEKIVKCSQTEITPSIISNFRIRLHSFNAGLVRDPHETIIEHNAIIEELRKGDPGAVEKLMREHIKKSREKLSADILQREA